MAIYLDNAATTKPCSAAVETAVEMMRENFGNPSSLHRAGLDAQIAVDKARKIIASSLGTDSSEIYFTSGATESNNLALRGASAAYGRKRRRIVISAVEHASVEETAADLERGKDFNVVRVSPREDGRFYAEDFVAACNDDTCILSMMLVNNETGYIMPVGETFSAIKRRFPHIITHCDCVQGFMKLPIRASAINADLISLSAHKIHGVKGAGAIYIKRGVRILPIVTGGKQEKGIRSGTESVPLIAAFGAAVEEFYGSIAERYNRTKLIKAHLLDRLASIDGISVNSPDDGSPYIINISAGEKRSEIMLHFLESRGIYVSSGSACSKGQQSGVLGQFGITGKRADSALRISITSENTEEELDEFVSALDEGMKKIRG